jgi:hypothetical protein
MPKKTHAILAEEWYEKKTAMMVDILGTEHDLVMHSIIPYAIGGPLDLYYFPNGLKGTAIATKELCDLPGEGSYNDVLDSYELVMFTRATLSLDNANDDSTLFGRAHRLIRMILNEVALRSTEEILNPSDTFEFPEDLEVIGGQCIIFDTYGSTCGSDNFGLLAVIAIHPSEKKYAGRYGSKKLLAKLKKAGYYPYSDLDRDPVA